MLKLLTLVVLAGLLVGASSGSLQAASLQNLLRQPEKQGFFGTVSSVSGDHPQALAGETAITVNTANGQVKLTATPATVVRIPAWETASIGDLNAGDPVAVVASQGMALRILVRADQPVRTRHFTGVLASVTDDGAVSLLGPEGESLSAAVAGDVADLRPGELLTAVLLQDLPTGALLVTGLDRAISSLDRIQSALEQAERSNAAATLKALVRRLEENSTRHLTVLEDTAQVADPSLAAGLRVEVESVKGAYAAGLTRFGARPPSTQVTGVITSIDEQRRRIIVAPRQRVAVEVAIAGGATIDFQGRALGLEQLDLGSRVSVRYDLETQSAVKVVVLGGETLPSGLKDVLLTMAAEGVAFGEIVDVGKQGPEGKTVVVREADSGKVLTLLSTRKSVISAGGQPTELGKDRSGAKVAVSFDPETSEIEELDLLALGLSEAMVSGVVHTFVAKTFPGNFSILTPGGTVRTFNRTADTVIRREGRRVSVSEVRLGDLVRPDTRYREKGGEKELLLLSLKSPGRAPVKGTIRTITPLPEGGTGLTLTNNWLDLISLRVTGDTQLIARGHPIKLDDLVVGQRVQTGAYDPISTVAAKLVLEPPRSLQVSGQITGIDEAASSITVSPHRGEPMLLVVSNTPPTQINIRGKPNRRLADLVVGQRVHAGFYDPATKQALKLVIN
jgi:hypothetical protein